MGKGKSRERSSPFSLDFSLQPASSPAVPGRRRRSPGDPKAPPSSSPSPLPLSYTTPLDSRPVAASFSPRHETSPAVFSPAVKDASAACVRPTGRVPVSSGRSLPPRAPPSSPLQLSFSPLPISSSPSTSKPSRHADGTAAISAASAASAVPLLSSSPSSVGCSSGATSISIGSLFAGLRSTAFSPPPFAYGLEVPPYPSSNPPCFSFSATAAAAADPELQPRPLPPSASSSSSPTTQGTPPSLPPRPRECHGLLTGVQPSRRQVLHSGSATDASFAENSAAKDSPSCSAPLSITQSPSSCPLVNPNLNFKFGSVDFPPNTLPTQLPTQHTPLCSPQQPHHSPSSNSSSTSPSPSLKDLPTSRPAPTPGNTNGKGPYKATKPSFRPPRRPPPPPHGGKGILPTPFLFIPVIPICPPTSHLRVGSTSITLLLCCPPFGPRPALHRSKARSNARRTRSGRSQSQQSEASSEVPMAPTSSPSTSAIPTTAAPPSQPPVPPAVTPTSAPRHSQSTTAVTANTSSSSAAPLQQSASAAPLEQPAPQPQCATKTSMPQASSSKRVTTATPVTTVLARQRVARPVTAATSASSKPKQGNVSQAKTPTDQSHRRCPRKAHLFAADQ